MTATDAKRQGMAAAELRRRAVLMLLLANFFWGLSFPTVKALTLVHEQLLPHSGNWFITSMTVAPRFLLGVLLMALWLGRRLLGITRLEWRQGALIGCFAGLGMLFQNDGLQFTSASVSAFLTQMYAILIPLWMALKHRRSPGLRVWLCCGLVLIGAAILGRFDWRTLSLGRGELETLVCSLFFMGQILLLEQPEYSGNRPEMVTFVMMVTELVAFACLAFGSAPRTADLMVFWTHIPWLGMTLVLTLFCTLTAFSIMTAWQPRISSTEAGLIYCVEPIFGSLMALVLPALYSVWAGIAYPNESATWHLLVGGGLITAANIILQLKSAGPSSGA